MESQVEERFPPQCISLLLHFAQAVERNQTVLSYFSWKFCQLKVQAHHLNTFCFSFNSMMKWFSSILDCITSLPLSDNASCFHQRLYQKQFIFLTIFSKQYGLFNTICLKNHSIYILDKTVKPVPYF